MLEPWRMTRAGHGSLAFQPSGACTWTRSRLLVIPVTVLPGSNSGSPPSIPTEELLARCAAEARAVRPQVRRGFTAAAGVAPGEGQGSVLAELAGDRALLAEPVDAPDRAVGGLGQLHRPPARGPGAGEVRRVLGPAGRGRQRGGTDGGEGGEQPRPDGAWGRGGRGGVHGGFQKRGRGRAPRVTAGVRPVGRIPRTSGSPEPRAPWGARRSRTTSRSTWGRFELRIQATSGRAAVTPLP